MNKFLKYTLKGLGIFVGILLLVYTAAYIYVIANKQDIIGQIKELVSEKLNGEVQIDNINLGFLSNFPSIAVELEKVSIRDTLFNDHKRPFLQAEQISASISFLNLLTKKNPLNGVGLTNGQLYIYTDTSGFTNSYLLSPKSKPDTNRTKGSNKIEIEEIKLKNVRVVLDDRQKGKLYDFDVTRFVATINDSKDIIKFRTKNDVLVHSLAFKTANGSYLEETPLKGNFRLQYDKKQKRLSFDNTNITLKGHPFNIAGSFVLTDKPTFSLNVATKKIDYSFARSLLTTKIASALNIVQVEKPIHEVAANISGPLKGGEPLVNVTFKVDHNNVRSPLVNMTDCSFNGSFTNELIVGLPRKDPNSRLQFHNFTGFYEGLKITSKHIYIDDLKFPMVNCDIKTDFNLSQLNNVLRSSTIDLVEGKGSINLTYSGPLAENSNKNTLINGKVTFTNGLVQYVPRNIQLKNVNGNIVFKNSDVFVTDLRTNVLDNKIIMNGSAKNLLALMKTNSGKVVVDWHIYSPALNIGSFRSLLKKRATVTKKRSSSKIGKNIDNVVNDANLHLDVKADELIYKRFKASAVKASVGLVNENWFLNRVSLQHAGGTMNLSGYLKEKNNRYYQSAVQMNMTNVDVNKVFYAFNNFGQNGIEAENLRGKLTTSADVKLDVDRELDNVQNINGYVDFSLKNGALVNYEPLQKVQNVVFKNRNFDNIRFAELKDRLDIKGKEIFINRMEIQSSVLTLFVEGVYSLRGNTDISIQVPLSNIKKRDETYNPKNEGADSKGGASIYVRGTPGDDGNIQFKIDLFKKLRKKKS